jgi:hypothetical protein
MPIMRPVGLEQLSQASLAVMGMNSNARQGRREIVGSQSQRLFIAY